MNFPARKSETPHFFPADLASIVAATVGSLAVEMVTSIPVAKVLSVPGWPFTVIFVAGVTLYSLAACVE